MSLDASVLLLLAACCIILGVLQASGWPRPLQGAATLALVAALAASGELASRTSTTDILRWAASPQRRQDLAALLLAEALLFGSLAVRLAQGQATRWWRWLGWLPPPSALLSLFFAEVAVMLAIDGWDYDTLSWLCAPGFTLGLAAATALLHWALPDATARGALRVGLHGAQAAAGLWLARPAFQTAVDPVPLWGDRLAIVAAVVTVLATLGWLRQRRQ